MSWRPLYNLWYNPHGMTSILKYYWILTLDFSSLWYLKIVYSVRNRSLKWASFNWMAKYKPSDRLIAHANHSEFDHGHIYSSIFYFHNIFKCFATTTPIWIVVLINRIVPIIEYIYIEYNKILLKLMICWLIFWK